MERPVLFINACVRKESRTRRLAQALLARLDRPYEEVCLHEIRFPTPDEDFLAMRESCAAEGDFSAPVFDLARDFAEAETIVIAAPYWDLSFPAVLKQYFEQVNVVGITFRYNGEGVPVGLCRADRIYYVTTAGGPFAPEEYGFGYIEALARGYYGIQDVRLIRAVGLDVDGADEEEILRSAEETIRAMVPEGSGQAEFREKTQ